MVKHLKRNKTIVQHLAAKKINFADGSFPRGHANQILTFILGEGKRYDGIIYISYPTPN